jgi:hypothetical protein
MPARNARGVVIRAAGARLLGWQQRRDALRVLSAQLEAASGQQVDQRVAGCQAVLPHRRIA